MGKVETVRMGLQLLELKDVVRAQSQRPEAHTVQHSLKDQRLTPYSTVSKARAHTVQHTLEDNKG